MDALMAVVSILAIIAIVLIASALIAFIGHAIIGALDNGKVASTKSEPVSENKGVIDYAEYKQLENAKQADVQVEDKSEYNFEEINKAKVEEEKKMAEADDKLDLNLEDTDANLEEIETRLKNTEKESDEDIDSLLDQISSETIEEKKIEDEKPEMSEELKAYNIDEILANQDKEETEEATEENHVLENQIDMDDLMEEQPEETEAEQEVEEDEQPEEPVEEPAQVEDNSEELKVANEKIETLNAQLDELNKQLEELRNGKTVEVVTIDATEEECLARLETLEERLKAVRKDYKTNLKEYRPLKKVMNDLDRYQTKLRRKEAIVAKKKVALYGVNNYVDIDKEKAEKLANELELLDGLRLSVSHCEEVINANKDRFPILEHTNKILEDQIANIESDIASTQATLQKIRDKKGNGEGSEE